MDELGRVLLADAGDDVLQDREGLVDRTALLEDVVDVQGLPLRPGEVDEDKPRALDYLELDPLLSL